MVYYIDTYTETIMFDRLEDALFFFLPRRCSLCRPQCPNQKMGKVGKASTPQAAGPSHGSLSTLSAWMLALTTEKAAVKQRENLLRKNQPSNEQRAPGNSLFLPGNNSATSHYPSDMWNANKQPPGSPMATPLPLVRASWLS